jgi:signal transduction histidine kinase
MVNAGEVLRRIPALAGIDDGVLAALAARARPASLAAGEVLIEEGSAPDHFFVVVEGELEARKRAAAGDARVAMVHAGDLIGEMALFEGTARTATVVATRPSQVLVFERALLEELLAATPGAAFAVLRMVATRLRRTEEVLQRGERLAALGRIAGGLAHELNNPATAVQRSAAALVEHVEALAGTAVAAPVPADPLVREARERALAGRLDAAGVAEAWDLAPALAARGVTPEELAGHDAAALRRIGHLAAAAAAAAEVREGARRIAELVGAVKLHTRVGRDAAPGEVDLIDSLERTLLLFGHRLRHVAVARELDPAARRITGWPAELGQVWMNLVDNAIDAIGERGTLAIRLRGLGDEVEVAITDSGPGIPDEVRPHLFEPFVTSKPPGAGSGLGLSICRHIVVNRHGGRIDAESTPGRTTFRVVLPRRAA